VIIDAVAKDVFKYSIFTSVEIEILFDFEGVGS
jgi:hypothetical protein